MHSGHCLSESVGGWQRRRVLFVSLFVFVFFFFFCSFSPEASVSLLRSLGKEATTTQAIDISEH